MEMSQASAMGTESGSHPLPHASLSPSDLLEDFAKRSWCWEAG